MQPFELAGIFEIQVTLKDGVSEDEILTLIDETVAEFLADGPTREELKRTKTKIMAAQLRGIEAIGGFSGKGTALAQAELYTGDPDHYVRSLQRLNHASAAYVVQAARKWLGQGYYQLTVRPYPKYTTTVSAIDRSTGLPAVGAMPELTFPAIEEATLANGMRVVVARRPTIPVVTMALQFDAGYAADAGRPLGTASFALSMMDEGTTSKSALEIVAEAESLGATLSTASNLDMSRVNLSALKPNLDASLALVADIVRNPAFAQDEIDRLRPRWLAGIEQEKAQPVQLALRALPPLLYGDGHSYSVPYTGSGTAASIKALTRDDLVRFHGDWLRPDNAVIFMVGDITLAEATSALEKAFGDWQAPPSPLPVKNIAAASLPEKGRVIIMDKPDSPQSLILAGHLFPPTGDDDHLTQEMANDILGGKFTSRINMNLREDKGWAYGAFTFTTDARGQRMWLAYAPVQTDKTRDSIVELGREFNAYLGERPATTDELSRLVSSSINSLPGKFETAGAVLGSILSNDRFGRDNDYVPSLKGRYEALDIDAIQSAAKATIHPKKLLWLIVGDRAQIEEDVRSLDLGDVEVWDESGKRLDTEPTAAGE